MVTCPECGVTLYSSDTPENVLRNHKSEAHGAGASRMLKCPHCSGDTFLASDGKSLLAAPLPGPVPCAQAPIPFTIHRGAGVTSKIG